MAQQATLLVLFLVFAGAILIQYMLIHVRTSSIELFKGKKSKRGSKSKKSKRGSKSKGKKGKASKGKKSKRGSKGKSKSKSKRKNKKSKSSKSKSKSKGKKSKRSRSKSKKSKRGSKSKSARKIARKSASTPMDKTTVPISPLSLSTKLENTGYVNCPKGYTCTPSGSSPMAFSEVVSSLLSPSLTDSRDMKDKLCASVDKSYKGQKPSKCPSDKTNCDIASRQMYNPNDYVKKDSIPCYGCNLN